jgi:hypothetical protein
MKKIAQSKGGSIVGTDIIVWNKNRDEKIDALLRRFSAIF